LRLKQAEAEINYIESQKEAYKIFNFGS